MVLNEAQSSGIDRPQSGAGVAIGGWQQNTRGRPLCMSDAAKGRCERGEVATSMSSREEIVVAAILK
jgi:hypothetical protein